MRNGQDDEFYIDKLFDEANKPKKKELLDETMFWIDAGLTTIGMSTVALLLGNEYGLDIGIAVFLALWLLIPDREVRK